MSNLCTIIGGRGYVGSALANHLRARGHRVSVPEKESAKLFGRDLGRVFYCAGYTGDFGLDPSATIEAHAGLLSRLLRDGEFQHLTYLSSTRVYDAVVGPFVDENEAFPLDPGNERHLYDLTKLLGEWLCLNLAPERSAIARLSCVYDGNLEVPAFLPLLVRRLSIYGVGSIAGWPQGERDYVHLDDVCQALFAISESEATGVFNVASGENVSNLALCRHILDSTGFEVVMSPPEDVPPLIPPTISIARIKQQFGIEPRSVMDALPEIIRMCCGRQDQSRGVA